MKDRMLEEVRQVAEQYNESYWGIVVKDDGSLERREIYPNHYGNVAPDLLLNVRFQTEAEAAEVMIALYAWVGRLAILGKFV